MNGNGNGLTKWIGTVLAGAILAGLVGGISMHARLAVAEKDLQTSTDNEQRIEKKVDEMGKDLEDIKFAVQRLLILQEQDAH